jgi:hypothetical protein
MPYVAAGRNREAKELDMDTSPIRAALSDLERDLESARDARYQIACEKAGRPPKGGYEEPEAALPSILNNLQETLLVVLEAAGLLQTRQRLLEKWAYFEQDDNGGIGNTYFDQEYEYLESKPFDYIEKLINRLRSLAGDGLQPGDSYELAMLENMLRKTPVLVRRRDVDPKSEKEVRDVMHDYLGATFTEYRPGVIIPGVIRDFKPDGGVRNLKAAIEFKFAVTHEEVTRAVAGIFEDISGYSGSLDWTRVYSVIYQTEAFESEDRIISEMMRAGTKWKTLLVTGAGARKKKQEKSA